MCLAEAKQSAWSEPGSWELKLRSPSLSRLPCTLTDDVLQGPLQAQEIIRSAYGKQFRPRPLLNKRVRAGLVGGKGRAGRRTTPSRP